MRKRLLQHKAYYHIYNRAVSKRKIFKVEADYRYFMHRIAVFKRKHKVKVVTFNIVPNHYHLLVQYIYTDSDIPKFLKSLQHSYALHFNKIYDHSGHVFQGNYCHKYIDTEEYLTYIIQYIKNNPVKHGIVKRAEDWPYRG